MKKYLFFVMSIVMSLLVISGCKSKSSDPTRITGSFDGIVKIKSKDKEYECELRHTPEQVNRLEVTKPENIAGLTFVWEGEQYKVMWKNLSCELNKEFLPQEAFAEMLINILNLVTDTDNLECEECNNGETIFTGNCTFGKFKVGVDRDGIIKSISIPDERLEAEFILQN